MKKILLLAVLAVAATTAIAQNNTLREVGGFTIQPKAGIGLGIITVGEKVDSRKVKTGFVGGVDAEYYPTRWLGVSLGLNYARQAGKIKAYSPYAIMLPEQGYKLDYLNLPILANFYVAKGLSLKTGVQPGILLGAKESSSLWPEEADIKGDCKKFNVSIPIGISYEICNIVLDLRYNLSLSKFTEPSESLMMNAPKSHLLMATIGYKFEL